MTPPEPLFVVRDLAKRFPPSVQALTGVSLEIHPGEVHALVGENGAGKSTLSRIIAGIEKADTGALLLQGRGYAPQSRRDAEGDGIRMVMQELNLVPTLSLAENIFLDRLPHCCGIVNRERLHTQAQEQLRRVGLGEIAPETAAGALGIGQQQLVEIARGLSARCKLLILDEPTAALSAAETELLFTQIQALRAQGVAILYISHRLEEIARIAQRITILRDGAIVDTRAASELSSAQIVEMMVGRKIADAELRSRHARSTVALRAENLRTRTGLRDVSFELYRGEILGLAGLMGSGRTETVRAIFGADPLEAGRIYLEAQAAPTRFQTPGDAVRAGIALVTEDRKREGLLLPASIRENISLSSLSHFRDRFGIVSRLGERAEASTLVRRLGIRSASLEQPVSQLSGGNQQKVVIARWLLRDTKILMFDEPTRGIDIGARFEIYELLVGLAEQGKAILVVSSELTELLLICNRIAVLSRGKLTRTFGQAEFDPKAIMTAALAEYSSRPAPDA